MKMEAGLQTKLDQIISDLACVKAETKLIPQINSSIAQTLVRVEELECENSSLKAALAQSNGKVAHLQQSVAHLQDQQQMQAWRQMRANMVIYNLPEPTGSDSNAEKCEIRVLSFLKQDLKIAETDIYSVQNLAGEIRVDIACTSLGTSPGVSTRAAA